MKSIVEAIRQGDQAAFRELFEDYYPILCVFAMKYLCDEEQCKDVAQDTLLSYWEKREDFEDIYKVKDYLYKVAHNHCMNILKRLKIGEQYLQEEFSEVEESFEKEMIRQETWLLVRKAVRTLPAQMRRVIELTMEGNKNAEIALELGIAEGTVHDLKKTAYKKLREQLTDHFYLLLF